MYLFYSIKLNIMDDIILEESRYIYQSLSSYILNVDIDSFKEYMCEDKINELTKMAFIETELKNCDIELKQDYEINYDKKYIKVSKHKCDMLMSIETENDIDKIFILIAGYVIYSIEKKDMIYKEGKYYFNGDYGLNLFYISDIEIIIKFNTIDKPLKLFGKLHNMDKTDILHIFYFAMRSNNVRKLYGLPLYNYNQLEMHEDFIE